MGIADDLGLSGPYVQARPTLAEHAPGIINRPLPINVSGAIPAVILDAGWPLEAIKAVPLLASADVFIQNFRPGVAEKLGAGEETLRAINPSLIYCAISGFGPSRRRATALPMTRWPKPPAAICAC